MRHLFKWLGGQEVGKQSAAATAMDDEDSFDSQLALLRAALKKKEVRDFSEMTPTQKQAALSLKAEGVATVRERNSRMLVEPRSRNVLVYLLTAGAYS